MTTALEGTAASAPCPECGTSVAVTLLSCPGCHRLVHGDVVKAHAARAEEAMRDGDHGAALAAWRASLDLLPPGSRQFAWVSEQVATLSDRAVAAQQAPEDVPKTGVWKWLAALGPVAVILWKFKFLLVAVLAKGKLLLLGLTKVSTLSTMFLAVGLYWTLWGLWFALGVVVSIYIHEMGHVAALQRYGIAASAPMFIPGFGALVRLKQMPATPREDARIGLAGPLWGLGAAVAALIAAAVTGSAFWAAVAVTGAVLNLFNLMPVWQLDGSRAFASLTAGHRWLAVGAVALAWALTRDGIVALVVLVAIARAVSTASAVQEDRGALAQYAGIAIALALVVRFSRAFL